MNTDKATFQEFREDFRLAMKSLEEKYNISSKKVGTIRIASGGMGFRFKVEFINSSVENQEIMEYVMNAKKHRHKFPELSPESYNKEVWLPSLDECNVVGIRPSARKYPVIVKQKSTGKKYGYSYEGIVDAMKEK